MVLARESREIRCDGFHRKLTDLIHFEAWLLAHLIFTTHLLKCTRGSKIYRTKSGVSLMFAFPRKHRLLNLPFNSGFTGAMTGPWWIITEQWDCTAPAESSISPLLLIWNKWNKIFLGCSSVSTKSPTKFHKRQPARFSAPSPKLFLVLHCPTASPCRI